MRITLSRGRLRMTQQLPNEQQRQTTRCAYVRVRVAKIVEAHIIETGASTNNRISSWPLS
jgi:hypothetical protein